MVTFEEVERLREKANVSYDDAKKALEACDGNMLDAIIYLERKGKIKPPKNNGYYNSNQREDSSDYSKSNYRDEYFDEEPERFSDLIRRFVKWCVRIIRKGNINYFVVRRNGNYIMSLPVTILVILLLVGFWVIVPLLLVGLFFGYRYNFKGPDLGNEKVNRVMDSVSNAAENIKRDVKEGYEGKDTDN